MQYKFLTISCVLAAISFAPVSANAAVITNGSFEIGNFVPDGRNTDILPSGSTAISGWTVIGGAGAQIGWIGPSNPFGLSAQQGSYFLDLTGDVDGVPYGGISQSFATNIGQSYQLNFYLGSSINYGVPDGLTVSAGNVSNAPFVSTNTTSPDFWEAKSLVFTATAATTNLQFQGNLGRAYIGLDNVSISDVTAVPEPLTLSVFGVGLAGAAALRRRKAKSA